MNEKEFAFWMARSQEAYAADKKNANSLTDEEARKIAAEDFQRHLPEGRQSPNNYLFSAKEDGGTRVGFVWFGARGPENNRRAFILDIIVEEEFRGKGYGRKMMLLVEEEARKLGLNRIGLHVFGYNKPAIRLYESLGYETTDLVMEKPL